MTTDSDPTHRAENHTRKDDEPWPFWAAILAFLNIAVIATMTNGLPGLVTVMAGAAIAMIVVLVLIVRG